MPARALDFTRSLLPKEWGHFLFLLAALLFLCASRTAWTLGFGFSGFVSHPHRPLPAPDEVIVVFEVLPRLLAYLAGFLCVVQSLRSASGLWQRFRWVFLPAILGMLISILRYPLTQTEPPSLVDTEGVASRATREILQIVASLAPGFYYALGACLLLAAGIWLCKTGRCSLPLRFRQPSFRAEATDETETRRRILKFVLLVFLLPFAVPLIDPLLAWALLLSPESRWPLERLGLVRQGLHSTAWAVALAWGAVVILRRPGEQWRQILRRCSARDAMVAGSIPTFATLAGIAALLVFSEGWHYFLPGDLWLQVDWATLFTWPGGWSLLILIPILPREIALRGYFQTRLIEQFGMRRGIFVVGLVSWTASIGGSWRWAGPWFTLPWILVDLLGAAVYAALLGWSFLRARSVIAPTLMLTMFHLLHRAKNELLFTEFMIIDGVSLVASACIAYWLFRVWPPFESHPTSASVTAAT